jgi:hypothetical protein
MGLVRIHYWEYDRLEGGSEGYQLRFLGRESGEKTRCPVSDFLAGLASNNQAAFGALTARLERVLHGESNQPETAVRKDATKGSKIFEIKAKGIRLFCFQDVRKQRLIVAAHYHSKNKGHQKTQNEAFKKANELRARYFKEVAP